jgi:thiamine-monophosphate kinase
MDEFDAIARLLAPLALGYAGAFELRDDAALLAPVAGPGHVVTTDTIIQGVHFRRDDPPETIARKLVRSNLSDLIAKGAVPVAAMLNLSWPHDRDGAALKAFVAGLGDDLSVLCAGTPLIGGDTTALDGPMVAGLTLFGRCAGGRPVLRRGAAPGDAICVTGVIGSSFLGLAQLDGRLAPPLDPAFSEVYRVPQPPPLAFAHVVAAHGRASLDVSDGLIGDCGHMARVSGVEILLDLEAVPLHSAAGTWRDTHTDPLAATLALLTGGDDYQVVMAVRPPSLGAAIAEARELGVSLTRIGTCRSGASVRARWDGRDVTAEAGAGGWRHRLG